MKSSLFSTFTKSLKSINYKSKNLFFNSNVSFRSSTIIDNHDAYNNNKLLPEQLTHIDPNNNMPQMVDVSLKETTSRIAHAQAIVTLPNNVYELLIVNSDTNIKNDDNVEIYSKKGPVFATAIIAGVMASKKTADLIPFCHHVNLDHCKIVISVDDRIGFKGIRIDSSVKTSHRTGVEMEALVGASTAALCIYDMLKAVSHDIVIGDIKLIAKSGGKRDIVDGIEASK
jgi:cyclic pyranopterin phosphate synthase